jgi:hypothetical protein
MAGICLSGHWNCPTRGATAVHGVVVAARIHSLGKTVKNSDEYSMFV